jgi:hypothetical protein
MYRKRTLLLIILSLSLLACIQEDQTCNEEDKIVKYTEVTTYYYTTMEPELVCP